MERETNGSSNNNLIYHPLKDCSAFIEISGLAISAFFLSKSMTNYNLLIEMSNFCQRTIIFSPKLIRQALEEDGL